METGLLSILGLLLDDPQMVAGPIASVEAQSKRNPDASPGSMPGNVLERNGGGRARRIQCCAPYRHDHREIWLRRRNSKWGGCCRRYVQRRRETAKIQERGNVILPDRIWYESTSSAVGERLALDFVILVTDHPCPTTSIREHTQ